MGEYREADRRLLEQPADPDQQPNQEVDVAPLNSTKQPPAFQLYASDFLGSSKVGRMSLSEIGMYTLLLCHSWNGPGLPTNVSEIGKLARMPPRRFEKVWRTGVLSECFVERNGRMVNLRQERIRRELLTFKQKQSENGKKGGRPRKPEKATLSSGLTQTEPKPKAKKSSPSPSPISTDVSKEQKHPVRDFLTLYETEFFALTGNKPVIANGRDAAIAKRAIKDLGEDKARALLKAFFASSDEFIQRSGYGLNMFAGQINKLLADERPRHPVSTEGKGRTGAPPKGKYDGIEEQD